jgi:hypothetical protein
VSRDRGEKKTNVSVGGGHLDVSLDEVLAVFLCVLALGEEAALEDAVNDLDLGLTDHAFSSVQAPVDQHC